MTQPLRPSYLSRWNAGRLPAIGERVVIRRFLRDTETHHFYSDVIGVIISLSDFQQNPSIVVRKKDGTVVRVLYADIQTLKVLPPRAIRNSEIRNVEYATAQAFPGLHHQWTQGWMLRAGDGITERSNSAVPLRPEACFAPPPLEEITHFYHSHNLPVLLHLPDRISSSTLKLVSRDSDQWHVGSDILVMTRTLKDISTHGNVFHRGVEELLRTGDLATGDLATGDPVTGDLVNGDPATTAPRTSAPTAEDLATTAPTTSDSTTDGLATDDLAADDLAADALNPDAEELGATSPDDEHSDQITFNISSTPDRAWLERYHFRGQNLPEKALRLLSKQIDGHFGFGSLRYKGKTIAITRGTLTQSPDDNTWLGFSAVEVDEGWRRRGLGTLMAQEMLRWGAESGAHDAYLQVISTNGSGISLYKHLGFELHHKHRYARMVEPPTNT